MKILPLQQSTPQLPQSFNPQGLARSWGCTVCGSFPSTLEMSWLSNPLQNSWHVVVGDPMASQSSCCNSRGGTKWIRWMTTMTGFYQDSRPIFISSSATQPSSPASSIYSYIKTQTMARNFRRLPNPICKEQPWKRASIEPSTYIPYQRLCTILRWMNCSQKKRSAADIWSMTQNNNSKL